MDQSWAKFGPSLGQIRPKQPIFKVETRDFGSLYVFENTHHYQCIHNIIWAYTRWNLGQVDQNWVNCWAKFEPNWAQKSPIGPNWIGVPIFIVETCPFGSSHRFDCYDHPGSTIDPILVHLTQIFTGVSSNNLMYALVVVSILKNVQWAKVLVLYDQNRYSYPFGLFWANWAQFWPNNWPNFGPLDPSFHWCKHK